MRIKWYALLFLIGCSFTSAGQQLRVALVIGAQNYTALPALHNSLNDAKAMTATLRSKGFQVETLNDPKSKREIKDAVNRYYNLMRDKVGAVGLIFYAGHGMQYEGDNYIIPTTATLQSPGDLEDQCVKMNTVMAVLKSASKSLNILLLDACRSLPSFTRDTDQGLTRMEAPQGSIIVFAAQAGKTASDGTGQNGLFTSKLIKVIEEPNLNITEVFKRVKQQVYAASKEVQLPSVEDNSIGGDFYFSKIETNAPSLSIEQLRAKASEAYQNKNYSDAFDWYKKAAEKGDQSSMLWMGNLYNMGSGVEKDYNEAVKWYRKAGSEGYLNLATMYDGGLGVTQDYAEAARLYRLAVESGTTEAGLFLGGMYEEGRGVEKNYAEAVKWYRKGVQNGDEGALVLLGAMYENGYGVTKNEAEAVRLYRQAADQGDTEAQVLMGDLYKTGRCVSVNKQEAAKWYKKAADQGDSYAKWLLEDLLK